MAQAAKSKSKQAEALQFLDDLDSFAPPQATSDAPPVNAPPAKGEQAAEALAFLDEITQKSAEPPRSSSVHISRSNTPTIRKSTERVRLGGGTPSLLSGSASSSTTSLNRTSQSQSSGGDNSAQATNAGGSWGWGSVWSTASAAIQQAKSAVDEQVKHLPRNEQARKWGEGVIEYAKSAQLDKLGQDFKRVGLSTLTDILNVVAPPISEHEVIQVWLSHDMQGYDGVESLVYRGLARILEQVDGGDLIVNRGNESRPKEGTSGRDLNTVDGYEAALKLALANIDDIIKSNANATQSKSSSINSPTTYSHVFLRVQPFFTQFASSLTSSEEQQQLQFLIYLSDPGHSLVHTTLTQAIPGRWITVWDEYDYVEDLVAEALRVGVEVIGQEYVVARMGWTSKTEAADNDHAQSDISPAGTAPDSGDKVEES